MKPRRVIVTAEFVTDLPLAELRLFRYLHILPARPTSRVVRAKVRARVKRTKEKLP